MIIRKQEKKTLEWIQRKAVACLAFAASAALRDAAACRDGKGAVHSVVGGGRRAAKGGDGKAMTVAGEVGRFHDTRKDKE